MLTNLVLSQKVRPRYFIVLEKVTFVLFNFSSGFREFVFLGKSITVVLLVEKLIFFSLTNFTNC